MPAIASAASQDPALFRRTLELLPAAAYLCDAEGLITWFNEHAAELWGRRPMLNDAADRYCGSFRMFSAHGLPIVHEECWMALALRNGREYRGQEIVVERPDGLRVTALAYATPLQAADGRVIGAVNILVNISDRKRMERLLADANRANDFYRATIAQAMREELTPMLALIDDLERGDLPADAHATCVGRLRQQVEQISVLVDQLLDVRPRDAQRDA